MNQPRMIDVLRRIVGSDGIIAEPEQLMTYETDGLTSYRQVPMAGVLPETTEQVSDVLHCCHEQGIPFVPRGSGTGLSGGTLPVEGSVVVSTATMQRILTVDLPNRRAVVQPGVINLWVTQEVPRAATTSPPIPLASSSARSAATLPRTQAASIASSTALQSTSSSAGRSSWPVARSSTSAASRSTRPVTI